MTLVQKSAMISIEITTNRVHIQMFPKCNTNRNFHLRTELPIAHTGIMISSKWKQQIILLFVQTEQQAYIISHDARWDATKRDTMKIDVVAGNAKFDATAPKHGCGLGSRPNNEATLYLITAIWYLWRPGFHPPSSSSRSVGCEQPPHAPRPTGRTPCRQLSLFLGRRPPRPLSRARSHRSLCMRSTRVLPLRLDRSHPTQR